jgi:hypothetical protein
MTLQTKDVQPYVDELDRLYIDALYGAQTQFEASKRLARHARMLILFPSSLAAIAGFLVAVGLPPWIGAVSAVAGVMSATASYLGADRKPAAYLRTAQRFTELRHEVRRSRDLARHAASVEQLRTAVETLGQRYANIVDSSEPTTNKDYTLADQRIKDGTFDYEPRPSLNVPTTPPASP